jgi:hypothetical protein
LTGPNAVAQTTVPKSAVTEPKTSTLESFIATTVNMTSGDGVKLRIELFRWSSDEERNRLVSAWKENGPEQFANALQALPEAGYVWTDESLGYSVHYAYHQLLHNGGERIILATDRPLGSWSGHPWTAKIENNAVSYPFTLIELLFNSSGRGEGKISLNSKVAANDTDKTIMLENSENSPALLKNVQRTDSRSRN